MMISQGSESKRGSKYVPKRKLIIRPFKVQPRPPAGYEARSFEKLRQAVGVILRKDQIKFSREELYRLVESLCIHKKAEGLYTGLHNQCESHTRSKVNSLKDTNGDEMFLRNMQSIWNDHCEQFSTIRKIFLYLDRTYVLQNPRLTSLWGMGLSLLRSSLKSNRMVEQSIVKGVLQQVERERKGDKVDRSLIKSLLKMLSALETYKEVFEGAFLAATEAFYDSEGKRLSLSMDVPTYLKHANQRLQTEKQRVAHYLDETTRRPLISVLEKKLIAAHVDALIKGGLDSLMDGNKVEDLALMYQLFTRVDALEPLRLAVRGNIERTGGKIVDNLNNDKTMIDELLALKIRLDFLVEHAFGGNDEFMYAQKQSFEKFVGEQDFRVAELLARHTDVLLKSGIRGMDEEKTENLIQQAINLFTAVQSKDVFQAFFQKDLGNRLLTGRYASKFAEKLILQKLKAACGTTFTKNMEAMFNDMDISDSHVEKFKKTVLETKPLPLDLGVKVLTAGSWPTVPMVKLKLPEEVKAAEETFKKFYIGCHKGRKLEWQYPRSTCILTASFPKGKKELAVTAFQAAVLLLFNTNGVMSMAEIRDKSGVDEKQLDLTLRSMLAAKLLLKKPPQRKLMLSDEFIVNANFKNALHRIKIQKIEPKAKREERKKTTDQVFADRGLVLEATIVRIMKTRKSLSHSLLVAEVMKSVKFICTAKDVKVHIDAMIDRDYVEKDENSADVYNYKA